MTFLGMSVAEHMELQQPSSSVALSGVCRDMQKSSFPGLYVSLGGATETASPKCHLPRYM